MDDTETTYYRAIQIEIEPGIWEDATSDGIPMHYPSEDGALEDFYAMCRTSRGRHVRIVLRRQQVLTICGAEVI